MFNPLPTNEYTYMDQTWCSVGASLKNQCQTHALDQTTSRNLLLQNVHMRSRTSDLGCRSRCNYYLVLTHEPWIFHNSSTGSCFLCSFHCTTLLPNPWSVLGLGFMSLIHSCKTKHKYKQLNDALSNLWCCTVATTASLLSSVLRTESVEPKWWTTAPTRRQ